ncbi:unnamed protein product [Porites evermanni]|uniref:Uncharacterized protein n=1 Tax=Porites evermanni TaxID=104178 RepID=A0ABN8M7V1_9CNID|nr:unnamed protein product [Porites evermanni]
MDVQQLFKVLKKEAECPLCLETVNNPKTLPCIHSFCLECLDKHANFARRQLQAKIKCPVCQTSFQIPEGDSFKNLPASYHLNRLVDVLALKDGGKQTQKCSSCDENNTASSYCFVCQILLCSVCFEAHQRLKTTRGHRNVVIEKLNVQDVQELIHRPAMCSQQYHENQPLEFYCEECKVLICHKCSVVSHNRHTMTDTQKAAQVQKMQMKDALEKVKAETVIYDNEIRKQTELMDKTKNEILSAEKKMADTVEERIHELREHERVMKAKFAEIYEAQQKHHATQLENFELVLTQLQSCIERGESALERNVSAEILQTNQIIVGRCEELLNVTKPGIYNAPHLHYIIENQLTSGFDRIVVSSTDPLLSLAEVDNHEPVGEKTQCYHEDDQVKVNILTPADDQLETEIKDTKDGKYTVTYTPQCVGQHRVEIQVNGQLLTGSPWFVQVIPHQYQFAFQFGSQGKKKGKFDGPSSIAVNDKSRTLAVADVNNRRVQMFGFDGSFLREIALKAETCSVCLFSADNTKTLEMRFCLECLDKHANFARRQLQATIKCPVCQTSFQIPEGDSFKNLPASYHLNRLVDVLALKDGGTQTQKCSSCDENNTASSYCFVCQIFLCTSCFEAHQRLKTTRGHRNVVIEKLQVQDVQELIHRPAMCSQQYHENQPLEFYCEECKVLICHKCSVVSHNRHTMTDTQKAAQVQKMQMKDALEKVKAETVIYENEIRKQTELMDKTKNEILSAEKKMADAVEERIRELREHERVMKVKFAEIYEAQQKHHATQLENFELVLTQLQSCIERGESALERNVSAEILQTYQIIVGRCEELLNVTKPDLYKPPHVNYIVENQLNPGLDLIVVSNTDPLLSLAEVDNQELVREKTVANFIIVTRDSSGKQRYHEDDQVKVNIITQADDQLETEVKDNKNGKYTVTYTPQCVGQHRVEIQVNGQPLTCSPWVLQVIQHQYQFAFQFGSEGKKQGQFNQPLGIAVSDKSRTLAVADLNNERVQMFGFDGSFLREIVLETETSSVAFTESGDLLSNVESDDNKLTLYLYTEGGQFN